MKLLRKLGFLIVLFLAVALVLAWIAPQIDPRKFPDLAFFGLGFRYILWANVAVFAIVVFKKFKLALIPLAAILLNFGNIQNHYALHTNHSSGQLKLLTWNVRLMDRYAFLEGQKTTDKIVATLQEEDAGIMCFQEFYDPGERNQFPTKTKLQAAFPKHKFHEKYTHHFHGQAFGVATFTKYPILAKGEIIFDTGYNNVALWSDLKIGADTIRLYNVHLSSIQLQEFLGFREGVDVADEIKKSSKASYARLKTAFEKRAIQTEKLLKHVSKSPYQVVLCGDFNDTPVSYCHAQFANVLEDAFVGRAFGEQSTYEGNFPSFRIDYVFHDEALEVKSYKTLPKGMSDHRGVVVELDL